MTSQTAQKATHQGGARHREDLRPSVRVVLSKVQRHKGWDGAKTFHFLENEVWHWWTLMNAGDWVVGAMPNSTGPNYDGRADQILTADEARALRNWHHQPWKAMALDAWERWMRELWDLSPSTEIHPWPEIPRRLGTLDIEWPVEWWPHADRPFKAARPDEGSWRVASTDLLMLIEKVRHNKDGCRPDIWALVIEPAGRFRLLRQNYQDWYEGRYRARVQVDGEQLRMEMVA